MEWSGGVELHRDNWRNKVKPFIRINGICGSNKRAVSVSVDAAFVRKGDRGVNRVGYTDKRK